MGHPAPPVADRAKGRLVSQSERHISSVPAPTAPPADHHLFVPDIRVVRPDFDRAGCASRSQSRRRQWPLVNVLCRRLKIEVDPLQSDRVRVGDFNDLGLRLPGLVDEFEIAEHGSEVRQRSGRGTNDGVLHIHIDEDISSVDQIRLRRLDPQSESTQPGVSQDGTRAAGGLRGKLSEFYWLLFHWILLVHYFPQPRDLFH